MSTLQNLTSWSLCIIILLSCGNSVTVQNDKLSANDNTRVLKLKKLTYIDQQGTGLEAFNFLMPSDWQFQGGITWLLDNPMMPAITSFRVFNPKGTEEYEVFPSHCYFWTNNPGQMSLFPPGSKYFGSTVKQPVTAMDALRSIVIPEHRNQVADFQIVKEENFAELAQALTAGKQSPLNAPPSGARIRVTYTKNGVPMEEEFWTVVEQINIPIQSMFATYTNTLWYVNYIMSFKAEKGKLDASTNIFSTILTTFKVNPQWFAKYSHVIEYLAQQQIQRIHSIGEFSRMLSRMSDQMSDEQLQQFEKRNSVYDEVAQKHSDMILGIDRYYDPHEGRQVELPSGYNHAWSNNNGEYIVTDNPNFNPNVGSNLHWVPLERK